jgi:hypothetical protein
VPTEYDYAYQSAYKGAFTGGVSQNVIFQWTGEATYSPAITQADAAVARQVFQHDLLIRDNSPVVP